MRDKINAMVVDLSHWDPAKDYKAVKNDGIVGVIYKATQGTNYTDPTYVEQQRAAKAAGLRWGAYHFAEATDVGAQVQNFMNFASPDPDELFCLDWEDNGSNTMFCRSSQAMDHPSRDRARPSRSMRDLLGQYRERIDRRQRRLLWQPPIVVGAVQRHTATAAGLGDLLALAIYRRPSRTISAHGRWRRSMRYQLLCRIAGSTERGMGIWFLAAAAKTLTTATAIGKRCCRR
jgi:hypothetical protein